MAVERFYTVDEANAEIGRLTEALTRIRDARRAVLQAADVVREGAAGDGGGREASGSLHALRVLREEVERLAAEGLVLRDADSGLVDFPARREGRLVYLCWRVGEERVGHWHEVDGGLSGRKPLDR